MPSDCLSWMSRSKWFGGITGTHWTDWTIWTSGSNWTTRSYRFNRPHWTYRKYWTYWTHWAHWPYSPSRHIRFQYSRDIWSYCITRYCDIFYSDGFRRRRRWG